MILHGCIEHLWTHISKKGRKVPKNILISPKYIYYRCTYKVNYSMIKKNLISPLQPFLHSISKRFPKSFQSFLARGPHVTPRFTPHSPRAWFNYISEVGWRTTLFASPLSLLDHPPPSPSKRGKKRIVKARVGASNNSFLSLSLFFLTIINSYCSRNRVNSARSNILWGKEERECSG